MSHKLSGCTHCAHYTPRVYKVHPRSEFSVFNGKERFPSSDIRFLQRCFMVESLKWPWNVLEAIRSSSVISVLFLRHGWSQRLKRFAKHNESTTQCRCSAETLSVHALGRTHLLLLHTAHPHPLHPPPWLLIQSSACVLRANEYRRARSLELS